MRCPRSTLRASPEVFSFLGAQAAAREDEPGHAGRADLDGDACGNGRAATGRDVQALGVDAGAQVKTGGVVRGIGEPVLVPDGMQKAHVHIKGLRR